MSQWLDLAFVFDADTRRADLVLGADGDLVLDETPLTPMLIAFGTDRRARADDELPTGTTELNAPSSFIERRGWAGDALDAQARPIGCRLWLLDRAKETELTRLMALEWLKEAYAWVERETGTAAVIEAEWRTDVKGVLALRIVVDGREITVARRVG